MKRGVILFLSLYYFGLSGQNTNLFIQNKNQWAKDILYKDNLGGNRYVYFQKNELTFINYQYIYQSSGPHGSKHLHPKIIGSKGHIFKVKFLNNNAEVQVSPGGKEDFYYNYFLGEQSNWASDVPLYQKLTYKNIYANIDLYFKNVQNGLKYEFRVKPHTSPDQIRLEYEGLDEMYILDNHIYMMTSLDTLIEYPPFAYQIIEGDTVIIKTHYKLKNKVLSYYFPSGYNENYPLIIDPLLVFATISGSSSNNWGTISTAGENGSVYSFGKIFGPNFPTSIGAFDMDFNGGDTDITILKFNQNGSLIYSTFLGGNNIEDAHSAHIDKDANLVILGTTGSTNFPTTTNAYDRTYDGGTNFLLTGQGLSYDNGSDIFIVKISPNGNTFLASTLLGSTANDGLNTRQSYPFANGYAYEDITNLTFDSSNNIYIAASTNGNIPSSNRIGSLRGSQDGIVAKFSSDLSDLFWIAYIGEGGTETVSDLALTDSGDLAIIGTTMSSDFPVRPNTIHSTYQGNGDAYIAILDTGTGQVLNATFLGTDQIDIGLSIGIDAYNNIVAMGRSRGNYPLTDGVYAFSTNSTQSIFLHKINSSLTQTIFSTRIGHNNFNFMGFGLDNCDQITLLGWIGDLSSDNIARLPTTSDAIQRTSSNGQDLYYMLLNRGVTQLLYGTYYGGTNETQEHSDGGRINIGKEGLITSNVCICGENDFPITSNAYASVKPTSAFCNQGLVYFDLELPPPVEVNFTTPEIGNTCVPMTVNFTNTSSGSTQFIWDPGDGSQPVTTQNFSHTYTAGGTYIVKLMGDGCGRNLAFDTITFYDGTFERQEDRTICRRDTTQLQVGGGISYNWTPSIGLTATDIPNPKASPPTSTTYFVTMNNGNCIVVDTVIVNVIQNLEVNFNAQIINTCDSLQTAIITNNTTIDPPLGIDYTWTTQDGQIITGDVTQINFKQIGSLSIRLDAGKDRCLEVDSIRLEIGHSLRYLSPQSVQVKPKDTVICNIGDRLQLQATGGIRYIWTPASSLSDPNIAEPFAFPPEPTLYRVDVFNEFDCMVRDSLFVNVVPPTLFNISDSISRTSCTAKPIIHFQNRTQGAVSYLWDFGDGHTSMEQEPSYTYDKGGKYNVTLNAFSGIEGCSRDTVFEVEIGQNVPYNAFSPNEDGVNDLFDLGITQDNWQLKIYNRWGALVYQSDNYQNDWTGEDFPAGTYYYTLISPEDFICRGWVAILR